MKRILVALLVVSFAAVVRVLFVKYGKALLNGDLANLSEGELVAVMMVRPNSKLAELASKELMKRFGGADTDTDWTVAGFDSQRVEGLDDLIEEFTVNAPNNGK